MQSKKDKWMESYLKKTNYHKIIQEMGNIENEFNNRK